MKNMLRPGIWLALCLTLVLGLVLPTVLPASTAAGGFPCLFRGTATVDGDPVDAGTEITAWVDGEQVGEATTGAGELADDEFLMTVELDEMGAPTVSFKIGDLDASETATFEFAGRVVVDLTATTAAPVKYYKLTVNVSPAGSGEVKVYPAATAQGYKEGTKVTLRAVPGEEYDFDKWTGDLTGSDDLAQITMDSDKSVTANFKEEEKEAGGGFPWWAILLIVLVVLAIIGYLVWRYWLRDYLRRRKRLV